MIYCSTSSFRSSFLTNDCDLCGRGIPTVIPVRVIRPILKFAYPERGGWKGLCEPCLDFAQKTYLTVSKNPPVCKRGKCALCGDKTGVFSVELQIPDFSKRSLDYHVIIYRISGFFK